MKALLWTLILLIAVLACIIVVGDALHTNTPRKEAPLKYITVVMEKEQPVKAVFEEESVYAKMRALQKKKTERNKELIPAVEQREKEREEYIKRRKNWVRYVDGEIITGYDPRYDRAFYSDSILVEYRG